MKTTPTATPLARKLAEAIASPAGVVSLDLRGSPGDRLSSLPPEMGKLKDLQVLHLEGNDLESVPEEFEKLKQLRELHLAHNRLINVRPCWYLKNLVVLNLHDNRLPQAFAGHHQKGLEMQVGGNPLVRGGSIGTYSKMRVLGIDTDALFPIAERAQSGSKAMEVIQLYGRPPREAELAEAKALFPKARVEHFPDAATGPNLVTAPATPDAASPSRTPTKATKLEGEQAAHKKQLARLAKEQGIKAKDFDKVARPCVELFAVPASAKLAVGASRFGGAPDLPKGSSWPRGAHGPMTFVAQLDLSEIAPYDAGGLLPARGLLSFFAGDFNNGQVLYAEAPGTLARVVQPVGAKLGLLDAPLLPPRALELRGAVSLPLEIEDDEDGGWCDVFEAHRMRDDKEALHRVLGHSFGDTEGIDDDDDDMVLLALGSDPAAAMEWGDAGALYFVIDRTSLAARAWERVRVGSTD